MLMPKVIVKQNMISDSLVNQTLTENNFYLKNDEIILTIVDMVKKGYVLTDKQAEILNKILN
jgi:hypothetical protein